MFTHIFKTQLWSLLEMNQLDFMPLPLLQDSIHSKHTLFWLNGFSSLTSDTGVFFIKYLSCWIRPNWLLLIFSPFHYHFFGHKTPKKLYGFLLKYRRVLICNKCLSSTDFYRSSDSSSESTCHSLGKVCFSQDRKILCSSTCEFSSPFST